VARFIRTAREFADALRGSGRKWRNYAYYYDLIELGDEVDTCMLRITAPPTMTAS
jgi:hypothetical protein